MQEIRAFDIKIHSMTMSGFLDIIDQHIRTKSSLLIQHGVNASSVVEIDQHKNLTELYNSAHLINIDGYSVVWALRFLGYKVKERVACPDLAMAILALAEKKNYTVFLLGASEKNLALAIDSLSIKFPKLKIVGYRNGYFTKEEEVEIVKTISDTKPDILFTGMPSPQKEYFAYNYNQEINVKYILGVGGFFDILAGKIKRAPQWIQNIGLEWFYRFIQEPRRMWHRYLVGNSKFIWTVLKEKQKQLTTKTK
jgi:N-acetylglucosaminyldiphosphoundecaprenol N-acetyl-beta-D-mannosaminyltransferase